MMSAKYFEYYTIILRGGRFFVDTLVQFGSWSITMTHFLQKLLSCNKLCAIIVVGRQHELCLPLTFVTHSSLVGR